MPSVNLLNAALAVLVLLTLPAPTPSMAEESATFYKDKEISLLVPYRPGGGYDQYARLIKPYLEAHTGAQVDVVNLPGSGGVRGATELFRSPADGLYIGVFSGASLIINEIANPDAVKYRIGEFSYLGRIAAEPRALVAGAASGITHFSQLQSGDRETVLGATGLGGTSYLDAVVVGRAFGLNQKVVAGFDNSADIRLALARGDVDAMWGSVGSATSGILAGDLIVLTHTARNATGVLEGIPALQDMTGALDAINTRLIDAWIALSEIGRPVAAPPGVPADRVAFLSHALAAALSEPELTVETNAAGRILDAATAQEIIEIVSRASQMEPDVRDLLLAAQRGEL